jgi:hypothetical protein
MDLLDRAVDTFFMHALEDVDIGKHVTHALCNGPCVILRAKRVPHEHFVRAFPARVQVQTALVGVFGRVDNLNQVCIVDWRVFRMKK